MTSARYTCPPSPHFPSASLPICEEASRLTCEFVGSLFRELAPLNISRAEIDDFDRRSLELEEIDAKIRLKFLQVLILHHSMDVFNGQLVELREKRKLMCSATLVSRRRPLRLPPEILAKIVKYRGHYQTFGSPPRDDILDHIYRDTMPVKVYIEDGECNFGSPDMIHRQCIDSSTAPLVVTVDARYVDGNRSTVLQSLETALGFAHRWHTLVIHEEPSSPFRILQRVQSTHPFLRCLYIDESYGKVSAWEAMQLEYAPIKHGPSKIKTAKIALQYLALTGCLFENVTKLTLYLRSCHNSVGHELRNPLHALLALQSLSLIFEMGTDQVLLFETAIGLPDLYELAISIRKFSIPAFAHACKIISCRSVRRFGSDVLHISGFSAVELTVEICSAVGDLAEHIYQQYPLISEFSLLGEHPQGVLHGWGSGADDIAKCLENVLRSLSQTSNGQWLFPNLVHLAICLPGFMSSLLPHLIQLSRSRLESGQTRPLQTIEIYGFKETAENRNAVDILGVWFHDIIVTEKNTNPGRRRSLLEKSAGNLGATIVRLVTAYQAIDILDE